MFPCGPGFPCGPAVAVQVEEKITLEATRDGDIESMEIKGFVFATVSDAAFNKIQISSTTNRCAFTQERII